MFEIISIITIVWAAMMIHQDINSIWCIEVEIREILKKCLKNTIKGD